MEALRDADRHPQARSHRVTRQTDERREHEGKRDDPLLTRLVRALADWQARHSDDEPTDTEFETFEQHVEEAERRFWAGRGDPATEAERALAEARRRLEQTRTSED